MSGEPALSKPVKSYYKHDGGNLVEKVTDDPAEAKKQGFVILEELYKPEAKVKK